MFDVIEHENGELKKTCELAGVTLPTCFGTAAVAEAAEKAVKDWEASVGDNHCNMDYNAVCTVSWQALNREHKEVLSAQERDLTRPSTEHKEVQSSDVQAVLTRLCNAYNGALECIQKKTDCCELVDPTTGQKLMDLMADGAKQMGAKCESASVDIMTICLATANEEAETMVAVEKDGEE